MLNNIQKKRSDYSGNYDGFFGKVSNFTWSFNPDGSYDISIDLITLGDVIESLKVNTFSKTITSTGQSGEIVFKEGDSGFGSNISKVTNTSTIGFFLYTQIKKLTKDFSVRVQSSDPNYYVYGSINSVTNELTGKLKVDIKPQYYIRLGEFFSQLENLIIPKVQNSGGNSISQITFNRSGNIISYFPNQIPLDPRVCLFKPSLNSFGDMEGVAVLPILNSIPTPYITTVRGRTYGLLSNLYINFEFIAGLLLSSGSPEQELPLIKFLQDLCNGINSALGGVNKLEPIIKDDNVITIIDQTLSSSGKENFINLEVYGYNPSTTNPTSNFVKDVKFVSKITPQLASMISIGAVAGGANTSEIDGTAFSKWNEGLQDRFSQNISEPSGVTNLQQEREAQEQLEKEQWIEKIKEDARREFVRFEAVGTETIFENIALGIEEVDLFFAELVGIENIVNPLTGLTPQQAAAAARTEANDLNDVRRVKDDYNKDIDNKPMTYQQYLYERYLFEYKLRDQGIIKEEELSDLIPKNYALYLIYAFGGKTGVKVITKNYTKTSRDTSGNSSGLGLTDNLGTRGIGISYTDVESQVQDVTAEPRYQEFNDDFISQGKAAYKNYVNNLNNETYLTTLIPSSEIGFIPLSFELILDGISGIKIYNQLSINNEFLPSNYPESLKFVITKVNHQITNNSWNTSLSTISIPRTEPYKFVESPTILSDAGGGSGGDSSLPDVVDGIRRVSSPRNYPLDNINLSSKYKNKVIYVPTETKKTMIILHHTAGEGGAQSNINWWRQGKNKDGTPAFTYPIATQYIIERDGTVETVFDEKYYSFHASNDPVSMRSIGIELVAWGSLTEENGKYKSWTGKVIDPNDTVVRMVDKNLKPITKPYRGKIYFQGYTPAQIAALENLFKGWKTKYKNQINFKYSYDDLFPGMGQDKAILSPNATALIPGVYSHNSTETEKLDIMPQKELLEMLKGVLTD
jgi:hypothetical protein